MASRVEVHERDSNVAVCHRVRRHALEAQRVDVNGLGAVVRQVDVESKRLHVRFAHEHRDVLVQAHRRDLAIVAKDADTQDVVRHGPAGPTDAAEDAIGWQLDRHRNSLAAHVALLPSSAVHCSAASGVDDAHAGRVILRRTVTLDVLHHVRCRVDKLGVRIQSGRPSGAVSAGASGS